MKLKKLLATLSVVSAAFAATPSQASPVLGNLNDGLNHIGTISGVWSLFVNAGDFITVTARRLQTSDIYAIATDGAAGSGNQVGYGDDNLSPYVGGPYGDPQFSFTAASTGEYSVLVDYCCSATPGDALSYFVFATGSTASVNSVPLPGTLALAGLGLVALGAIRRKKQG